MKEKLKETGSFLFESFLTAASDIGKEKGKELLIDATSNGLIQIGGGLMIDIAGASIPGIGGAISSYRTSKKINNIEKLMLELEKRNDELKLMFEEQTKENKKVLDDIFALIVEKAAIAWQEEKIAYMINGYSEMLKLVNPSFDTAYLYFDTLDKLTILDIDTLKLAYNVNSLDQVSEFETYEDILSKYDINYDQYVAVRDNLNRLGLMSNEYDDKLGKDIENIESAIAEIRASLESVLVAFSGKKNAKMKSLTRKSKLDLKAKDRLKISKYGRDFIKFFIKSKEQ